MERFFDEIGELIADRVMRDDWNNAFVWIGMGAVALFTLFITFWIVVVTILHYAMLFIFGDLYDAGG